MSVMVKSPSGVSIGGSAGKGFPPGDVTIIASTVNDKTVLVKWSDPDDTIVEGTTISKWKGTLLVRKQGSYPTSIKDGDIVCDNTIKNKYKDEWFKDTTGLTNHTVYYYRFFTYSDAKVYNDSSDLMFKCTPLPFAPVFSDNTWEQITAASESGSIPSTWKIGDEINIQLSGDYNETLTLQIWDFNHYEKSNGTGKARLVLGCKHLMKNISRLGPGTSNYGGWNSVEMKNTTLPKVFASLPSGLQAVIKEVKTKTNFGNGASVGANQESLDKLFLPSIGETGLAYTDPNQEGPAFPIFTDNKSRTKKLNNGTGNSNYWWTRSPGPGNYNSFCVVTSDGSGWGGSYPSNTYGVCFCFCI